MPSGKVHHDHWKMGWVGVIIIVLITIWHYPFISIGLWFGYFLGQFITPDADLVGVTYGEGRMLRKLPLIGGLFLAYWTFYGALFRKQHRSFWTHSYISSTIIRFVYSFWWVLLIKNVHEYVLLGLLGVFFGMCISDGLHIWADLRYGGK